MTYKNNSAATKKIYRSTGMKYKLRQKLWLLHKEESHDLYSNLVLSEQRNQGGYDRPCKKLGWSCKKCMQIVGKETYCNGHMEK
jgi:hypothetical protein